MDDETKIAIADEAARVTRLVNATLAIAQTLRRVCHTIDIPCATLGPIVDDLTALSEEGSE